MRRVVATFLWVLVIGDLVSSLEGCMDAADCGWNSACKVGHCECMPGYFLAANNKDCYDVRCGDESCLECGSVDTCLRCVAFIERGTGRCLESCGAPYDLVIDGPQMGKVCPEGMGGLNQTYLVIAVSACAGLLLVVLLCLLVYWRFRMHNDRQARLKFLEKMMERQKSSEKSLQIKPRYRHSYQQLGNPVFDGSSLPRVARDEGEVVYLRQLLAPYRDHLLDMLREAQTRLAHTHPDANNTYVYRNIIQQLGRVLVLLNNEDAPVPSDAIPLLQWAQRILTQYLRTLQNTPQYTPQSMRHAPSTPVPSEHAPVTPPSSRPRSVVTSTFRPDQQLVTTDSTDNFKYQPCPALISDSVESIQQCREVSEINIVQLLADHNIHTEAGIDV